MDKEMWCMYTYMYLYMRAMELLALKREKISWHRDEPKGHYAGFHLHEVGNTKIRMVVVRARGRGKRAVVYWV